MPAGKSKRPSRGEKDVLPWGKPPGWPHHNLDAEPRDRRVSVSGDQQYRFIDNSIKTSKYEIHTFLPLFLLEEFNPHVKVANAYFLVIAALQAVPWISNTNGLPTFLLPLSVVVFINGAFQAIEDWNRHKADAKANSTDVTKLNRNTKEFETARCSDLQVGDIIRIDNRGAIPADVCVIAVHETTEPAQGICYVETKQLDGETNLKSRFALTGTAPLIKTPADLCLLAGHVTMEHPNNLIDSFAGVVNLRESKISVPGYDGAAAAVSAPVSPRAEAGDHDAGASVKTRRRTRTESMSANLKHPLDTCPIQAENLLLRGCTLRNTQYAYGLVLNTGHDTKIMMSTIREPAKMSSMETFASEEIKKIMVMLIVLCAIGAIAQYFWNDANDYKNVWYLGGTGGDSDMPASDLVNFIISFFYFFLLHASCIPVSLYVSMSISRVGQMYFMNNDLDMYYPRIDAPANVRTMNLNEDLGKVTHIFSDKTGTLTSNIMNFRKMSINGVAYGKGITEIGKASWKLKGKEVPSSFLEDEEKAKKLSVPSVAFYCPDYCKDMVSTKGKSTKGKWEGQIEKNHMFFKILALCHDTVCEHVGDETKLSASNPDDESLVAAAAHFGFKFTDRVDNFLIMERVKPKSVKAEEDLQALYQRERDGVAGAEWLAGEGLELSKIPKGAAASGEGKEESSEEDEEEIEILAVIKFTSKRKRMSVIVKDSDGKLLLLSKGADTAMIPRISEDPNQRKLLAKTITHVEEYSDEGLRCLLVCYRELEHDAFVDWFERYNTVCADVHQIELRKSGLPNRIEAMEEEMEGGLTLVGATALEDRLQDGVPECIRELAKAGLVIWVLTGDKEETAINIAIACNLLAPPEYMDQIIINQKNAQSKSAMRALLIQELLNAKEQAANNSGNKIGGKPRALVIDGPSLIIALREDDDSVHVTTRTLEQRERKRSEAESIDSDNLSQLQNSFNMLEGDEEDEEDEEESGTVRAASPIPGKEPSSGSDSGSSSCCGGMRGPNLRRVDSDTNCFDRASLQDVPLKELLLELSKYCKAVVACRVSPDQKREMVNLIKKELDEDVLTLAIGDGANDVPMIKGAHIGVGIRGEEGQQAVNSADYAIAQFAFLGPLLLKHGRGNYIRMSKQVCYIFYKNVFMSVAMFWFNFYCGWSGQKVFAEGAIQMHNLLFTSLPILFMAIYDQDINSEIVRQFPRIYASRDKGNSSFDATVFWSWIFTAIVESCLITVTSMYFLEGYNSPRHGYQESFWASGALAYTAVVIIANMKLFAMQNQYAPLHLFILGLSIGVWFLFAYGLNHSRSLSQYVWYDVFNHVLSSTRYWAGLAWYTGVGIFTTVIVQGGSRIIFFQNSHILQERSRALDAGKAEAGDSAATTATAVAADEDVESQEKF